MANDLIDQIRRYLDYAAETTREPVATMPSAKPTSVRWFRRGPVLAGLVAILILALAVPSLILGSGSEPPVASEPPDPLAVGVDYVWPEGGFGGSPEEIAAEFVRQALGWTDFETTSSDRDTPDASLWTTIQHPGSEVFEVLSIPFENDRRVLVQIGSPRITTGVNANGTGQFVSLPPMPGVDSAYLHIRFVDPDRVEVVRADRSDLDRGRVDISQDSPIGGVIVVYVDDTGRAITAVGTHYGPLDETTVPAEEVTYTTYVEDGNVWIQSDCPGTDHVLKGNPDGLPHISSTTDRPAIEEWFGDPHDARLIPRNGEVWERTTDGSVVVTQVEDWMIEQTLDNAEQCPQVPQVINGVPVLYRVANN